jgi:branched-chain amino acid transport system permease protein
VNSLAQSIPTAAQTLMAQSKWAARRRPWPLVGVGVAAAVFPFIAPDQYSTRLATLVTIYVILALGLNVVVGLAGLLDLGFIAFFGIGAYFYALVASPMHGLHISFWLAIPLGMAVTALFGVFVGLPALRTHGDYLAIVTLAFGEIVFTLLVNLDRPVNITNGPQGIIEIDPPVIGSVAVGSSPLHMGPFIFDPTAQFFWLILAYGLLVVAAAYQLQHSRLGRAWRAIRESEVAAMCSGVSVTRAKLSAFVFGAMVAGGCGVMTASWYGSVFPDSFIFTESVKVLAIVVLGGMGSIEGVIVGALALVLIPELLRQFQLFRVLIFGLVLATMMVLRPQGLIPATGLPSLRRIASRFQRARAE